jgi:rSAM/selenodomain-associated transferase 2
MRLSIVVPVLDEATTIGATLAALAPLRRHGHEVIVVDGGSRDATATLARAGADRVIDAPRGRASQMNAGAAVAGGDTLLFLHADTRLPEGAARAIAGALARGRVWGRFDVRLDSARPTLALVAAMMNLRSRLTGIATGDQAIFATRDAFARTGGFPSLPLMEDIAFSKAMKRLGRPACLRPRVVTSARRWERHGVWRTILLMWRLRFEFWAGRDPARLHRRYDGA